MTISTYASLTTAITDRTSRNDLTATILSEAIALAEAEMQRKLITLEMETKTTFSITGEYVALPTGLLEVRDFYLNTSPKTPLRYRSPDLMSAKYGTETCRPSFYCIVGTNFRFANVPDTTYSSTLVYLQKFTPIASGTDTNWLITNHPDAYLYGACKQIAIRPKDIDSVQGYGALFDSAMSQIETATRRARWSGPTLEMRPG